IQLSILGSISLASSYGQYGAAAMVAAANTQAAIEHLTTGINVQVRARQLLTQAVADAVAGGAKDLATQQRLADVTKAANDNVASGALAYDRLDSFIQEHVKLLELQDIRQAAVIANDQKQI